MARNRIAEEIRTVAFKDYTTLTGANPHTDSVNVFKFTGVIYVFEQYEEVVTALGNHTNAYYDIWDGSTSVSLDKTTTCNPTNFAAGSFIHRRLDAATNLGFTNANGNGKLEANAPGTSVLAAREIVANANAGVDNFIRYVFTTTDTTDVGSARHYIRWKPLTIGATLTAV